MLLNVHCYRFFEFPRVVGLGERHASCTEVRSGAWPLQQERSAGQSEQVRQDCGIDTGQCA
jgi:hypothetical protein